jgi:hypothetical protein
VSAVFRVGKKDRRVRVVVVVSAIVMRRDGSHVSAGRSARR